MSTRLVYSVACLMACSCASGPTVETYSGTIDGSRSNPPLSQATLALIPNAKFVLQMHSDDSRQWYELSGWSESSPERLRLNIDSVFSGTEGELCARMLLGQKIDAAVTRDSISFDLPCMLIVTPLSDNRAVASVQDLSLTLSPVR